MADWSSLPGDLVFSIGDLLLADDDLDYYMNFRAVCSHWRQSSLDPKEHSSDPRFQLKKWAVIPDYGCNHNIKMVNLRTCRIVPNGPYNYIVESAGELLVVTRRINVGLVDVHKVDTVTKVLEPVTSIGRRAIFISQVRSFVVDAFPSIEAGCIYFVDADLDLDMDLDLDYIARHRIIASSYRLEDQTQEDIMESGKVGRRCGPPTILEVLIDYCRSTPTQEYELAYREKDDDDFEGY
ncbi:hypothetical protein EJB05_16317, partial [Eragrostis curvula]